MLNKIIGIFKGSKRNKKDNEIKLEKKWTLTFKRTENTFYGLAAGSEKVKYINISSVHSPSVQKFTDGGFLISYDLIEIDGFMDIKWHEFNPGDLAWVFVGMTISNEVTKCSQ
jgi:hypothetical protein